LEFAHQNEEFSNTLFKSSAPPTFVEYNPKMRFLEESEGRIVITVNQPVPLIRYDTNDRGGIFNGKYLSSVCKNFGYRCPKSLLDKNFVYVYGRADAVRLLSNIYIEDVQYCLKNSKISQKLTGNFKYGLKGVGFKNILKLIVYLKEDETLKKKEEKDFSPDFQRNLADVNPDFKMVSKGIRFSFDIEFSYEPEKKYKGGKFNYFL
jgi:phenylacetate-coenzyme A ligase PaaK-like adenylate-forming protein